MRGKDLSPTLRARSASEARSKASEAGRSQVRFQEQAAEESLAKLVYSVKEAAELLGVHSNTLRRAIARGELRAARLGDRVLIPRGEIQRLLEGGSHAN